MTDKILNQFKTKINGLTLIPDKGGCFEVKANGELIYSKLATGQFPDEAKVVEMIAAKLKK